MTPISISIQLYECKCVLFLTVLVGLYEEPERPANAVDYIKRYMGAPTGIDVEALRAENEQLKRDKAQLETTILELNSRVSIVNYSFIPTGSSKFFSVDVFSFF